MPRLRNETVLLREYRRDDIPHINKLSQNHEITSYLSPLFYKPHLLENTEKFYDFIKENDNDIFYIIADPKTEEYIGQIDIAINWKMRLGGIGIALGDHNNKNKGYGTSALQLLIDYSFTQLDLNRIELEVLCTNELGINCYKKCGFIEEGIKREMIYKNGKYQDVLVMAILKKDYFTSV